MSGAVEAAAPTLIDLPPAAPPQKPAPSRDASDRAAAAKTGGADQPDLGLGLESGRETALSSDGATRLIVTAYIGIGNRLHLRGEGPGLDWTKGVPLQFVSIGKWRWETTEASAPVRFKIYKNDQLECPGLGEGRIEPGHQHELTANF